MPGALDTELGYVVLDMDFDQLKASTGRGVIHPPVKVQADNLVDYYEQYQPLILEEVNAILKDALRKSETRRPYGVKLTDMDHTHFYQNDDATVIKLVGRDRIDCSAEVGGFRFIVSEVYIGDERFLGILNIFSETSTQLVIKGDVRKHCEQAGDYFTIKPLASLVNLDRMYDVCTRMPDSALLASIRSADVSAWPVLPQTQLGAIPLKTKSKLNAEQEHAVRAFVAAEQGVRVMVGPPGTGKTTTLEAMFEELIAAGECILASAPSNQAVGVMAERAYAVMPNEPMLLIGVEARIKPALHGIFFDNWVNRYPNKIKGTLATFDVSALVRFQPGVQTLLKSPEELDVAFLNVLTQQLQAKTADIKKCLHICLRYASGLTLGQRQEVSRKIYDGLDRYIKTLESLHQCIWTVAFPVLGATVASRSAASASLSFSQVQAELARQYSALQAMIVDEVLNSYVPNSQEVLLSRAKMVFCTHSTAGKMYLRHRCPAFTVLMMDEAGQAVEPEADIALSLARQAKKILIVGDPKQLPATTISPSAKQTHFNWSILWRLVIENRCPVLQLTTQYRMGPTISHYPSKRYYEGNLKNHESVLLRTCHSSHFIDNDGFKAWVTIDGKEESDDTSYVNRVEAESILEAICAIRERDLNSTIGVVSFYGAQIRLIKQLLSNAAKKNKRLNPATIAVSTVDGFQGGEEDFILISFVRANHKGKIGFVDEFTRLNVAITRARHALMIFAEAQTFAKSKGEVRELFDYCRAANLLISFGDLLMKIRSNRSDQAAMVAKVALPHVAPIGDVRAKAFVPATPRPAATVVSAVMALPMYTDDELLEQAARFYHSMQYEKAIELYRKVLDHQPKRPDIYEWMATCYEDDARDNPSYDKTEQVIMMRAVAATLRDELSLAYEAAAISRIPIMSNPEENFILVGRRKNVKADLKQARTLCDNNNFVAAEQIYKALATQAPDDSEVLLGLGWCLHKQRKHKEAITYFDLSLELHQSPLAYQGLIQCHVFSKNLEHALDLACACLDNFPMFGTMWELKARIERDLEAQQARSAPKAIVAQREVDVSAVRRPLTLGDFLPLHMRGDAKPASIESAWSKGAPASLFVGRRDSKTSHLAPKPVPFVTQAEIDYARDVYRKDKDPVKAEQLWRQLLTKDPTNYNVLTGLGWCLHTLKRDEEGVDVFKQGLSQKKTADAYFGLARCYKYINKGKALETIGLGLQEFPGAEKLIELRDEINQWLAAGPAMFPKPKSSAGRGNGYLDLGSAPRPK